MQGTEGKCWARRVREFTEEAGITRKVSRTTWVPDLGLEGWLEQTLDVWGREGIQGKETGLSKGRVGRGRGAWGAGGAGVGDK